MNRWQLLELQGCRLLGGAKMKKPDDSQLSQQDLNILITALNVYITEYDGVDNELKLARAEELLGLLQTQA